MSGCYSNAVFWPTEVSDALTVIVLYALTWFPHIRPSGNYSIVIEWLPCNFE